MSSFTRMMCDGSRHAPVPIFEATSPVILFGDPAELVGMRGWPGRRVRLARQRAAGLPGAFSRGCCLASLLSLLLSCSCLSRFPLRYREREHWLSRSAEDSGRSGCPEGGREGGASEFQAGSS